MSNRWGPGPVFVWEWIRASRRWQLYALCAFFYGILLATLLVVWMTQGSKHSPCPITKNAGESIYFALVGMQLTLVLLVAPTATAGAICLDKTRGTILQLLVTDLSSAEIVLGKLFARLLPVLGLILSSIPVFLLATFEAGVDSNAIVGAYLVTLGTAVLSCTLALTFSAWGRTMHKVLIATYSVEFGWLLFSGIVWPVPSPGFVPTKLQVIAFISNPYLLAFAPYSNPGLTDNSHALTFVAIASTVSLAMVRFMIWRLRAVILSQANRASANRNDRTTLTRPRQLFPRPSLDGNPILWYECRHRQTRWMPFLGKLFFGLAMVVITLAAVAWDWTDDQFSGMPELPFILGVQIFLGLLFLSIRSATVLSEDRARGNLDVLLTTPLSSREIVMGEWRALFREVLLLALVPGLAAIPFAFKYDRFLEWVLLLGLILAYGAAITALGVFLSIRTSRPFLAMAWSVGIYVLVTMGPSIPSMRLDMVSPCYGVCLVSVQVVDEYRGCELGGLRRDSDPKLIRQYSERTLRWATCWILWLSMISYLLLRSTVKSFDRCMGRIS